MLVIVNPSQIQREEPASGVPLDSMSLTYIRWHLSVGYKETYAILSHALVQSHLQLIWLFVMPIVHSTLNHVQHSLVLTSSQSEP